MNMDMDMDMDAQDHQKAAAQSNGTGQAPCELHRRRKSMSQVWEMSYEKLTAFVLASLMMKYNSAYHLPRQWEVLKRDQGGAERIESRKEKEEENDN